MKIAPRTFTAVMQDGQPHLTAPVAYRQYLAQFGDGEDISVTLEPYEVKRSLDQNAYFHAEPLLKWMQGESDFEGLTPAQAKLVLLGMYFGYEQTKSGVWIPMKSSTSELTKAEFTLFIEWLIEEGNARGINVLPPEPDPSKRDKRVRIDEAA